MLTALDSPATCTSLEASPELPYTTEEQLGQEIEYVSENFPVNTGKVRVQCVGVRWKIRHLIHIKVISEVHVA